MLEFQLDVDGQTSHSHHDVQVLVCRIVLIHRRIVAVEHLLSNYLDGLLQPDKYG